MSDVQHDPAAPVTPPPLPPTEAPTAWTVPQTDARDWARGKTWEEVATVTDQMTQMLRQASFQPPTPVAQSPSAFDLSDIADGDVVDGKRFKEAVGIMRNIIPAIQQNTTNQANMFYLQARVDPRYKPVLDRYEPEVLRELNQIPHHARTLDSIGMVCDLVAGRHVQDLAREMAQREASLMGNLPVRTSGYGAAPSPGRDGIPDNADDILRERGLTWAALREFSDLNQSSPKDWFDLVKKQQLIGSN